MLRRLHPDQPESFAFTPANQEWAEAQVTKYPDGRQASAVIPLLWRAQEQEGWLTRPAMEEVARMLDMAYIRVLEVATFYFMFQLQPVGTAAHIQVCGTTSCMICGAEDLVAVCKEKIAPRAHQLNADGTLSWEEVECLGSCANAPMAQIGKDYYEDLTAERFGEIIDALAAGEVPTPGPQNGRHGAEPLGGLTTLKDMAGDHPQNASVALAASLGDTVKRIDGTEVPLRTPWRAEAANEDVPPPSSATAEQERLDAAPRPTDAKVPLSEDEKAARPDRTDLKEEAEEHDSATTPTQEPGPEDKPATLEAPRDGTPDDLQRIKGIGPKLEALCHDLGFYHFDQIAGWTGTEVAWVDHNLQGFKGRVTRDEWVAQARALVSEDGPGTGI
ncbi:MAG: NADH-quinone oxidoreductase subunit E [Shimia sp.]